MNIEILKVSLNAAYIFKVVDMVRLMAAWNSDISRRLDAATHRERTGKKQTYRGLWSNDDTFEEEDAVVDLAGLTIFTPNEEDLEDDNLFADCKEDDDFKINADSMHCAFERFDSLDDRECASGLYS